MLWHLDGKLEAPAWRVERCVSGCQEQQALMHSCQGLPVHREAWSAAEAVCGRTQRTLRDPPKSRQATASLMRSAPKICGAMRFWISSTTLGSDAYSLNSASS